MEHRKIKTVSFDRVNFYSKLIKDYLSGELKKSGIIDWDYSKNQVHHNKKRLYSEKTRKVVSDVLKDQYKDYTLTNEERNNLNLFSQSGTFSVTTGHQLVLLGGPLFFYTKILDIIQLAKELSTRDSPIVPFFWLASEDHDYAEISTINLFGKQISCPGENKGPVGRLSSDTFQDFLKQVNELLGNSAQYAEIKSIVNKSFIEGNNLTEITKLFVRELFKDAGLLIIDGDDPRLKKIFAPFARRELLENISFQSSKKIIKKLSETYKIQVNPRTINLFYMEDSIRLRLIEENGTFSTPNGARNWTSSEMEEMLTNSPEKLSPNVVLRPLYQEILLPNLAYVGGAGEIAYWLELKPVFDAFNVAYPLPVVRQANFLIPKKSLDWMHDNALEIEDFFGDIDLLINAFTKSKSSDKLDFSTELEELKSFYERLKTKGGLINPQLEKVVKGEEKRSLDSFKNLEKRFLNADKQKYQVQINKLKSIHAKLFPKGLPMERVESYVPYLSGGQKSFNNLLLNEKKDLFGKKIQIISV